MIWSKAFLPLKSCLITESFHAVINYCSGGPYFQRVLAIARISIQNGESSDMHWIKTTTEVFSIVYGDQSQKLNITY